MAASVSDLQTVPRRLEPIDGLDDRALVVRFKEGSPDAYEAIFSRYRPLAYRICFRILGNRDDALEATQETMLRVLRGLPVFNGRYQLQAWVARIAKNVSVDVIRARARRPVSDASLVDLDQELSSREDDLDRIIERILEQEDVRATLDLIPLHHREALLLREIDGRSHREIADAMGMSSAQAKALIHRAKGSFRKAWDGQSGVRSLGALVLPILLAPLRLPGFLRRLGQPAHDAVAGARDVVANASSSATQAAATVASSPAVTNVATTVADKVTAATVAVLVAGSVGVGAVAVRNDDRARPAQASPAPVAAPPVVVITEPPVESQPVRPAIDRPERQKPAGHGAQGPRETEEPAETDPVPTDPTIPPAEPDPVPPPPPPPAPEWSGSFETSVGLNGPQLSLVSAPTVVGHGSDMILFNEAMSGAVIGPNGDQVGTVYVDFGGSISGQNGSLASLWLWVDTAEGHFAYAATGTLAGVTLGPDGATAYAFTGRYALKDVPVAPEIVLPHDGVITITLGFWPDGTLYSTAVALSDA